MVKTIRRIIQRWLRFIMGLLASFVSFFVRSRPGVKELTPIKNQLLLQPATVLVKQIKSGKVKVKELVNAFIERIKEVDSKINAVVDDRFNDALKEADQLDEKISDALKSDVHDELLDLPLLGIPFTGKDSIAMAGMFQTAGMFHRKGVISEQDALCVANLRRAGAIPIALTNVPELCFWFDSDNTVHGRTNNPYDLSRIPGGSTGGNAACIAYGGSVFGVGGDIGGSIRMPAFFCGCFGHKTAPGVVALQGHFPDVGIRAKFLSLGPLCRYAIDLKPVLKIMAGDDISKIPNIDAPVNLKHIKLYYMYELGSPMCSPVEKELKNSIDKIVAHMRESHSVEGVQVKLFGMDEAFDVYLFEMKNNPAESLTYAMKPDDHEAKPWLELMQWPFGLSEHTLPLITLSLIERYTADSSSPEFHRCVQLAERMRKQIDNLLNDNGILLFPPHPEVAPKHKTTIFKLPNVMYTAIFNILNVAITSCPTGLSKDGIPLGVQVIGAAGNDHITIAMAEEIEKTFGGWMSPSRIAC